MKCPRSPCKVGFSSADEGFAAIDAVVALAILTTTIILSLGAAGTAARLFAAAAETSQAKGELGYLLDSGPRAIGLASGEGAGFSWQIRTEPEQGMRLGQAQICRRAATVRSQASGRRYSLVSTAICPT